MNKRIYNKIFLIVALIWLRANDFLLAQGEPPGGDGGGSQLGGGDAGIPLDGGIVSLLLAGLGILAVRKFKRKKS